MRTASSNVYTDGILWGGKILDDTTITYSFWNDASLDDAFGDIDQVSTVWYESERASMQQALAAWSNIADLTFVQVADDAAAADFGFLLVNNSETPALGLFSPPGSFGEGIGYFNWEGVGWDAAGLQQGGYGFITLIHELGHGLGLAHPHDAGGGSVIYPGVEFPEDLGDNTLNQGIWTTMSYNDGWESENGELVDAGITEYGYQGTPMAFDIAAVQQLYGANTTYNIGNDLYRLPEGNGEGTFYSAIWDAGGIDTISAATAVGNATIDLNPAPLVGTNAGGYLSAVDGVYGGYTIANGAVIEQAIGGLGNDVLVGNDVANSLDGGPGDDSLFGKGDRDRLQGGTGSDSLVGGSGDDIINGYGGHTNERDVLSGDNREAEPSLRESLDGADTFVLGDASGAYYLGDGYATITDFYWFEGDTFQVYGRQEDYSLGLQAWSGSASRDTMIYYRNDLIGVVQDTTDVMPSMDFVFV